MTTGLIQITNANTAQTERVRRSRGRSWPSSSGRPPPASSSASSRSPSSARSRPLRPPPAAPG